MTTLTDPLLPAPEPAGPPAVSRFEYNLLRILRFLLGSMPADQAQTLVYAKFQPAPPCLTRTCVRLLHTKYQDNSEYAPVGGRVCDVNNQ